MEEARKRKSLSAKTRLRVLKRDNFKCTNCGISPAIDPRVYLEVDHYEPFSKGGSDEDDNLKTLCRLCNRGKGNDDELNKALDADLRNLLDRINPDIVRAMATDGHAMVLANSDEYTQVVQLNRYFGGYQIEADQTSTIVGFGAGRGMGLYTLNDNGGSKVRFQISPSG